MTLATLPAPVTGRFGAGSRSRPAAAFRAARRHSLLVRGLRLAIPLGTVLAIGYVVISPFLSPLRHLEGVSLGGVSLKGGKVAMELPRLSGYRKDNRPYEVTAKAALQDIRKPTQIELVEMQARIQMEREGWATIAARTGQFDTQKEQLQLQRDVTVKTESGYDVRMNSADIDFKAGTVVSREPVKVNLGTTTIDADTLDLSDNGKVIVFQGRVRAVIENAPAGTLAGPSGGASVTTAPAPAETVPQR